jgi:hypothetical protein
MVRELFSATGKTGCKIEQLCIAEVQFLARFWPRLRAFRRQRPLSPASCACRQVPQVDFIAVAQQAGTFEQVAQFADISRGIVVAQPADRRAAQARRTSARDSGGAVFRPAAQCPPAVPAGPAGRSGKHSGDSTDPPGSFRPRPFRRRRSEWAPTRCLRDVRRAGCDADARHAPADRSADCAAADKTPRPGRTARYIGAIPRGRFGQ